MDLPGVSLVPTADLSLLPDGLHLDAAGQRVLGIRFAEAMIGLLRPRQGPSGRS